jgi:hypothetical protein
MNIFRCDHCGHLVSFDNSECVRCGYRLAYLPDVGQMGSLESLADGHWHAPAANGAGASTACARITVHATSATGPSTRRTGMICACRAG